MPGTEMMTGEAGVRARVEFWAAWAIVHAMGVLPRRAALVVGRLLGGIAFVVLKRLREVGRRNLERALPELMQGTRDRILRGVYRNLGTQLAQFCQMPRYSAEEAGRFIRYAGLAHYLAARAKGKGVLVLTGHLGAWELSSYYHSLMGHPMGMVIRRLDNPMVDKMVNRIRCLHGNKVLHKDDFARGLLAEMRAGRTVGILMDTNMTPPQGVFVPFFGTLACTASGLARVARKTGAAVLPGFLLWEGTERKYVLHFGEELHIDHTHDDNQDAMTNTARFTAVLEQYIRRYPDQWLWMHRRWKTRPPGREQLLLMARLTTVAEWVGGHAAESVIEIEQVSGIADASPKSIVYATEAKLLAQALSSSAGAILADRRLKQEIADSRVLWVDDAKLAFARVAVKLRCDPTGPPIHPKAIVEEGASIGDGSRIGPGAVISSDAIIGRDCEILANVTIYAGTTLGDRVVVQAGAVLGSTGFGYVRDAGTGRYVGFPQQGTLVIEDDVEIGANSTIDRGALGVTRIGRGTKIDNLVHIAHNCVIGEDVVIAAQTGISGSTVIGDGAVIGGQVGIGDHASIGDRVILGSGSGVLSKKKLRGPGEVFWGIPAQPLKQYLRDLARMRRG